MQQTEELRRLLEAATPGPWTVKERGEILCVEPAGRNPLWQYVCQVGTPDVPMVQADAALIASAVNALPALCDEVERLRAAVAEERERCAKIADSYADLPSEDGATIAASTSRAMAGAIASQIRSGR